MAAAWNFGPDATEIRPVGWVVEQVAARWGKRPDWKSDARENSHEANTLLLDSGKARSQLGWLPKLGLADAIEWTVDWYRAYAAGEDPRALTVKQLRRFPLR